MVGTSNDRPPELLIVLAIDHMRDMAFGATFAAPVDFQMGIKFICFLDRRLTVLVLSEKVWFPNGFCSATGLLVNNAVIIFQRSRVDMV